MSTTLIDTVACQGSGVSSKLTPRAADQTDHTHNLDQEFLDYESDCVR